MFNQEDKTEAPTPHRREEFRRKGQVFRSMELTSAVVWLAVLLLFSSWGMQFALGTKDLIRAPLAGCSQIQQSAGAVSGFYWGLKHGLLLAAPIFAVVMLLTLFLNLSQAGFVFSSYNIVPRMEKLDPGKALGRIFSQRSLFELAKSIIKVAAMSYLVYATIRARMPEILSLGDCSMVQLLAYSGKLALTIGVRVGILWLALALLDYLYQRWEYEKKLRMTRHELKEDLRNTEGDPHVRGRIRERQRRLAMMRMMQEVPRARVVITNPTHLAVALRYDEAIMRAPVLTARGGGAMAAKIIELARRHQVPVVENRMICRAIYRRVDLGQEIPKELYEAVAEIIAYVYRQRGMERLYGY